MPKSRYALLDVIASTHDLLTSCEGFRVNNIYDINEKTYAFKLHQSGAAGAAAGNANSGTTKKLLLMESGVRFHLTSFTRDKSDNPSPFTMKLRKHLRGKRLNNVKQLGMDRVVAFTFGSNEATYHLILELYDKGNIILCDYKYEILGLLRSHVFGDSTLVANRQIYPLFNDAVVRSKGKKNKAYDKGEEQEKESNKSVDKETDSNSEVATFSNGSETATSSASSAIDLEWDATRLTTWMTKVVQDAVIVPIHEKNSEKKNKPTAKKKKSKTYTLKQLLSKRGAPYDVDRYGPDIVEHCLWMAAATNGNSSENSKNVEIDPNMKLENENWKLSNEACTAILLMLKNEPNNVVSNILSNKNRKGYILYRTVAKTSTSSISTAVAAATTTIIQETKETKETKDTKENLENLKKKDKDDDDEGPVLMYNGFSPYLLKQNETSEILTLDSFDKAADEFFAKIETQKATRRHQSAEKQVTSKLNKMKNLQKERLDALENEVSMYEKYAMSIENNVDNVQNAILVVNSLLANGMEWEQMSDVVAQEKRNGNPIANMISKLSLETNSMHLLLPKSEDELEEQKEREQQEQLERDQQDNENGKGNGEVKKLSKAQKKKMKKAQNANKRNNNNNNNNTTNKHDNNFFRVKIDLSLTAYQNARAYYDAMKKTKSKTGKAKEAAVRATKEAEKKSMLQIEKQKISVSRTIIREARQILWFEKFKWFISSENYLVISGRDMQQNELLVKRYLRVGDAYVHADVHGAASCIVRNLDHRLPIAPLTLEEAGHFCMCNSSGWDSKIVTSAWWVHSHQVSKTANTGEYLTTGSFMIRGKKNFLRPSRLELGYGILFRIDEDCVEGHVGERTIRSMNLVEEREKWQKNNDLVKKNPNKKMNKNSTSKEENREDQEEEEEEQIEKEDVKKEKNINQATSSLIKNEQNKETDKNVTESKEEKDLLSAPSAPSVPSAPMLDATMSLPSTHTNGNNNNDKTYDYDQGNKKQKKKKMDKEEPKLNRGQKRRQKKLKKKYINQDEDEKRMRMEALGNPMQQSKTKNFKDKNPKEENGENGENGEEEKNGNEYNEKNKKKNWGGERTWSADDYKRRAERKQIQKKQQQKRSQEMVAEEPGGQDHLEVLTGRPTDEDVFKYCLPVCAPYSVLSKYKFKVKLTPGSQKRGKASKEAIEMMLRGYGTDVKGGKVTEREKAFIRLITDNERVQAMVAKVKVSRPSGVDKKGKGGGKKGKKGNKGGGKRAAAGKNKGKKGKGK